LVVFVRECRRGAEVERFEESREEPQGLTGFAVR